MVKSALRQHGMGAALLQWTEQTLNQDGANAGHKGEVVWRRK